MPRVRLTVQSIPALPPHPKRTAIEYFDEQCQGLALRVSRGGSRSWNVIYRHHGRQRRFTVGRFPAIGLADARQIAREVMLEVARGGDPAREKRSWRHQLTIDQLASEFIDQHVSKLRSARETTRLIDREIRPRWGKRAIDDLSRREVIKVLDEVAGRTPYVANRLLAVLRKMYNWAIYRDLLTVNPCHHVTPPGKETKRDRVLSPEEVVRIWNACGEFQSQMRVLFRLRLLTAQRGGEIRAMRWDEINDGWWTIPASKAKNGKSHRVPLSPLALQELESLDRKSEWVFPSPKDSAVHIDNDQKAAGRLKTKSGVADFRPHDLRRTAASMMASQGVSRTVISKILNHAETGVTAIYERYSYDKDKAAALLAWEHLLADWLMQFERGDDTHLTANSHTP